MRHIQASDGRVGHEAARYKSRRRPGKPDLERWVGDSLHRDTGEWIHREYVVDHDHNRYSERITDRTGRVIHECDEPLDQHRDRGSARRD